MKQKNMSNPKYFLQFLSNNQINRSGGLLLSNASGNLSVNQSARGSVSNMTNNVKSGMFSINTKNFLYSQSQNGFNSHQPEKESLLDQKYQSEQKQQENSSALNPSGPIDDVILDENSQQRECPPKENMAHQQEQQEMLKSRRYNSGLFNNLNCLDYYSQIQEINEMPDRMYQILMLMRHASQFAYFCLYCYGLLIYSRYEKECSHNAGDLINLMFLLLAISTLFIFFPLVLGMLYFICYIPIQILGKRKKSDSKNKNNNPVTPE